MAKLVPAGRKPSGFKGFKEHSPLNNNRGNNNRRRGRGNNRPQGGGQQLNRIDSRARGNAPQLLEKYRKLAHDAHLNGDRVTEEYYLQFADHYFRVIADARVRQEDQRPRRDDRWQDGGGEGYREDGDEGQDYGGETEEPAYPPARDHLEPREDRVRREEREGREPREPRQPREPRAAREPRDEPEPRDDRPARFERPARSEAPAEPEAGAEQLSSYEPPENPFTRDAREPRGTRGLRPRRTDRQPRSAPENDGADDAPQLGLDPSSLPPAISAVRDTPAADADDAEAKPKRRGRKPKAQADDAGEPVAATGTD
jgi:hypothetical protein